MRPILPIILTIPYHMDLDAHLCPQRSSTSSTTVSLLCSLTGKDNKKCTHVCTPKSVSFSILAYHLQTNGPWSTQLGSANEAVYGVHYESSRTVTFFERNGSPMDLMASHLRTARRFRALHVRIPHRHMGGVQLTNPC